VPEIGVYAAERNAWAREGYESNKMTAVREQNQMRF